MLNMVTYFLCSINPVTGSIPYLQYIGPGLNASKEDDSLLGLVDLLHLVGHHQGQFWNLLDDVTWRVTSFLIAFITVTNHKLLHCFSFNYYG